MKRKGLAFRSAALVALTLALSVASTATASATTYTDNIHVDFPPYTDTFDLPCVGTATVTDEASYVIHTANNSQGQHTGQMFTGTLVVVPADSSLPTYTGTYAGHAVITNVSEGTFVANFTSSITLEGSDGSTIHLLLTSQFVINANGEVTAQFDSLRCA